MRSDLTYISESAWQFSSRIINLVLKLQKFKRLLSMERRKFFVAFLLHLLQLVYPQN